MKLKIKLYFLTNNYPALKNLLFWDNNTIKLLTKNEIAKLLDYSLKNQERILPLIILTELVLEDDHDFSIKEILKYLSAFFPAILKNPVLIYNYAKLLSTNPQKNAPIINKIKDYNLNSDLTDLTLFIFSLDGFYDERIVEKIIKSQNIHYIYTLLKDINISETQNILERYLKTIPEQYDIYSLSKILLEYPVLFEIFLNVILKSNIDNETKSAYLLSTLKGTNKTLLKERIIASIIELNSLLTINDLMQVLTSEEQTKLSKKYLETKNDSAIFSLACTTNCSETKKLIDYIFPKLNYCDIIKLIINVKSTYLNYIFKKIIQEKRQMYLKILNELYLIGSNKYIDMILFISKNKLESLFDINIIRRLKCFTRKSKNNLPKKRILKK